jgi:DNA invertase Pin-like site-specific DNA recombinase
VSTTDQDPALQIAALEAAGVVRVFVETAGGTKSRPQLEAALDYARPGDVLVVWKLDRMGRSLVDLIDRVQALQGRGIGFRSLTESIDTTTPGGRMVFHVFAALAEFERDLIRERTTAGLATARARGKQIGRPTVMTPERVAHAKELHEAGVSYGAIARTLGVSRATVTTALTSHLGERK